MAAVVLTNNLLRALPPRASSLLVGGVDLLPSVGPGMGWEVSLTAAAWNGMTLVIRFCAPWASVVRTIRARAAFPLYCARVPGGLPFRYAECLLRKPLGTGPVSLCD